MFECSICGLLSLNAVSCPACGSQNLIDLSLSDSQNDDLPTEIPGLDDAAESWHELEGSAEDNSDTSNQSMNQPNSDGNLPFGFSGESNVQVSRLPFGIGSHADGIPFENQPTIHDDVSTSNDKPLHNELSETSFDQNDITSFEETEKVVKEKSN